MCAISSKFKTIFILKLKNTFWILNNMGHVDVKFPQTFPHVLLEQSPFLEILFINFLSIPKIFSSFEKINTEKRTSLNQTLNKADSWINQTLSKVRMNFWILVLSATFSNISAISWQPVLVVEEAGVPGENYRPWASNW